MSDSGSSRLLRDRLGETRRLTPEAVAELVKIVDRDGIKVLDWTIYGTPSLERVVGTIQVPIENVGRVTQEMLTLPGTRLGIGSGFPYGIVSPEGFQLSFDLRAK